MSYIKALLLPLKNALSNPSKIAANINPIYEPVTAKMTAYISELIHPIITVFFLPILSAIIPVGNSKIALAIIVMLNMLIPNIIEFDICE